MVVYIKVYRHDNFLDVLQFLFLIGNRSIKLFTKQQQLTTTGTM